MSSMFRRPTHPHPSNPNSPATSSTKTRKSIDASPSTLSISSIAGDSPEKRRRHLPPRGEMLHSISPIGDIGPMTMPKNGSVHIRREDLSPTEVSPELGVATAAPTSRNSGEHSEMYNISDGSSPHSSIRSRSSSHDSPGSRTSPTLPGEKERKRHSPRTKHGSSSARMKSPEDSDRRRRVATERDRKKVSPLYKRLGEEPPFMLPHPSRMEQTSQTYPGVVIGAFSDGDNSAGLGFGVNGMRFDSSMDDIMDIKAAPAPQGRNDSTGGLMGANIAPWLTDDTPSMPDSRAEQAEQPAQPIPKESPRKGSIQALNHFASVPALPRTKRHTTASSVAQNPNASSSRSGSQPNILPGSGAPDARASSNRSKDTSRSRAGSGDSVQTFGASQPQLAKTGSSPSVESSASPSQLGRQASVAAGNRGSRFGSTASNISGAGSVGSDKKKGFLGGLLKRKTGASSSMNPIPADLAPADGAHRDSGSGSTSSRLSGSPSVGSLSQKRSHPSLFEDQGLVLNRLPTRNGQSYSSEGAISPLQEKPTDHWQLDMNLDDMEGIVDPNLANAPAPPSGMFRGPAASGQTTVTESTQGSMLFRDAMDQSSSFATTVSSGSGSWGPTAGRVAETPDRSVLSEAHRQLDTLIMRNPFGSSSSAGSVDNKPRTPPSPHTLSPKYSLPPTTQPRRPSQLRNVKMGSTDSESSNADMHYSGALQPLAPAWATSGGSSQTVFNDPFGSSVPSKPSTADGMSPSRPSTRSAIGTPVALHDSAFPGPTHGRAGENDSAGASGTAAAAAAAAAWAAPESWGVEGDEVSPEDSSSSEDEEDWGGDDATSPSVEATPGKVFRPQSSPSVAKRPPPFGFKSAQPCQPKSRGTATRPGSSSRPRVKTSSGRPSTATRPATGRPGTSGSAHISMMPHLIRIYRADGSHNVMSFPLLTTTAEIVNVLSGANEAPPGKKVTTSMRMYLRERGQDRQLLPSERPLAIQDRRLRQAGFTDGERLDEIGKEDLAILVRFIYQTPALPVIDPDEESSYDSFEFIDIGGRDLQTIPIFLHLHAHNIIILNVSRNPMTDLPLDFIQACTGLKEVRMSNMALKRVPASIRASQTLSRLDVSSNRIADLESVPLYEISTLLSVKVQNNKLTSIPSYFAQMKALKYLNISNNKFEMFPAVVCEMCNLVDLDISFNEIAELPSEMSNLKSLERLAVYGNELTTFPESFNTLANLRELDVRRNRLTNLNSVYALPKLTTLQADHNNLVTLDAQLGAKVLCFSVPNNSITGFTLAPLPKTAAVTYALTELNLSHGKISTLADEAFSGLVNLVSLNLNFNQMTRLPSTIDRLTNLETFSCTDNLLANLFVGFGKMQKLRTINLHNNNLKEIPGDLWVCSSLESFNASSNLLDGFEDPPTDLAQVQQLMGLKPDRKLSDVSTSSEKYAAYPPMGLSLQKLYLADNQFTDDVFHSTASMPELRVLNLSFNEIYEVPPDTLSKNDKLEALYLSGNKLTSLPAEDLEKLQELRVLHLNGNKLQTLPSELGALTSLQHLDVGSNVLKYNIANWPYDWNWNWNTALRYLNLSGNKRLEIKPTSAQDMSHASTFRKELSDFTALTQLRLLGLMDVTLRIPSLPDESEEKRVRTSFSDINNMAYGIADMLGTIEHVAMFDLVVPNFRGKDNECLFGMFGRAAPSVPAGRIPKFLQESFANTLSNQLERLRPDEDLTHALRRTFLFSNRMTFEHLVGVNKGRKSSINRFSSMDSMFSKWQPGTASPFRNGSSGAVVYLVGRTMYVGNVGDCLVVLSRKGEAELLSKLHDPTDREETARIRRAEAWVSEKGYINDDKDIDVSRAFGYWQTFPAVNASPEIRTRQLSESDEFVIIGNQALWKCCSYQVAVDVARTERDDPMMAAQKLRDFAVSYGAEGSVMVMVVNISDLFFGRGQRPRGVAASGLLVAPDTTTDGDGYYARDKRNIRRRYEEVGDRTLNRLQQEIEPPQGQVALVFTDIVNSTFLWETNPGMPTAIKMHHTLMRRQLRLDGGYEVKTEGDAFMVSFQTVTSALLWAFNCQIGLLQQEWPRELLEAHDGKVIYDSEGNLVQRGLRVRMGIHWGSPSCERDPITRRMDYYGPMVNRAARINARADGGQLMASQDVLNELQAFREYVDSLDEDSLADLPPELKREVMELRRIGLAVKDMGERKLKGLEVPEKLHLLYPKILAGRLEISNDLRANVEVNDDRTLSTTGPRLIDIDEVRELSQLTLRLEALCSAQSVIRPPPPDSPVMPTSPGMESPSSKRAQLKAIRLPPPAYLGPAIREDMQDDELAGIIESLTTRIENCMSTMYIKHLGGFSSVLAALEQATGIDQKLIVHAMSLMNGVMKE